MPLPVPPPGDQEALPRHNDRAELRLFKLVRELLEIEGLTQQCADFVLGRN